MKAETIAKTLGARRQVAAGWHVVRRTTIASRASRSATQTTAGCWSIAMRAATKGWVIAALRSRGLWSNDRPRQFIRSRVDHYQSTAGSGQHQTRRACDRNLAGHGFGKSTLVETYLRSLVCKISPPTRVRFHTGLKHPSAAPAAMVA
jgi:hypothetical protein